MSSMLQRQIPINRLDLQNYKGALTFSNALYYVYTTQNGTITTAAGVTGTDIVQIQADAAFIVERIGFSVFQDAGFVAQTLPPLLIQLTDTGSGATLFSGAVPLGDVAYGGQSGGPSQFDLPMPRLIAPSAQLQVAITNLDGAHAYTTRVNFQGRKIFSYKSAVQGL